MNHTPPTVLSVFSGAGGLDLGLEAAGFRNIGCIEVDEHARTTLKNNRPRWPILTPCEVMEASNAITPRTLGLRRRELSLLAGAPPCQPFSKAAQWSIRSKRGVRDPRSRCLAGFMGLVHTLLPRMVLIENVQGFVTGKGNAVPFLEQAFHRINAATGTRYRLEYRVVDAAHYGVPQRRLRAVLFAEQHGAPLPLPAPSHLDRPVTAWDAIGHLQTIHSDGAQAQRGKWLKLLASIPEGQNYLWHTPRGGGRPLFGYRCKFWSFLLKLAKDQPSWTLPAQPGPYAGPFHWENRRLTIREMLRLQSFPVSWEVSGPLREQIRQVGNATPPLLAEIIGRSILSVLLNESVRSAPLLSIPYSAVKASPASRLARVPAEFRTLERAWPDHPGTGRGPSPVRRVGKSNAKKSTKQKRYRKGSGVGGRPTVRHKATRARQPTS